jgi:hypothetical protein
MKSLYVIKGMGRGFDGLVVEAQAADHDGLYMVTRIINHNAIFGDRSVSFPVPSSRLYLSCECLEEYDEELREYDDKNPNGAYLGETRVRRHNLEAVLVEYERSMTVTVLEHVPNPPNMKGLDKVHTRYTQNYLKDFGVIRAAVDLEVKKGDLDDLIFSLRELKEQELQNNG